MKLRPLSASSIKTYLQCLLKYHYRYIEKKPRQLNRDPLALGTAVHTALERMYELIAETGEKPGPEQYKIVYKAFMDSATSEGLSDLSLYQLGKDMVTKRLDEVTLDEKVISLEYFFELKTPKGTPFVGAMDKLLELDPETAVVIDYKTSKTALTQDEADSDIQMAMYDLAVSIMYPQYKNVILMFDYVRLEQQVLTHRTKEQRALFVDFIDSIYSNMAPLTAEEMVPTLNNFCGWCDYKNFCPKFAEAVTDPDLVLPRLDSLSDGDFVNTWIKLDNIKRVVDQRKRAVSTEAHTRISRGGKEMASSEYEIYKIQSTRKSYDVNALIKTVPKEKLGKLVSANVRAVNKYLQNNPEIREEIEKTSSYTFNSPSFRYRKKSK